MIKIRESISYTFDEIIEIFHKANEISQSISDELLDVALLLGVLSYTKLCEAENAGVTLEVIYEEEGSD